MDLRGVLVVDLASVVDPGYSHAISSFAGWRYGGRGGNGGGLGGWDGHGKSGRTERGFRTNGPDGIVGCKLGAS